MRFQIEAGSPLALRFNQKREGGDQLLLILVFVPTDPDNV
jgi:hypothetical protein